MVGCLAPHFSSLSLTGPLRLLEYAFVEFSRQKVRAHPDPTNYPRVLVFLTRYPGCNGPTSAIPNDLPKTDVTVQVVLETYSTRPFLGCGACFMHQRGSAGVLTNSFTDLIVEYARPRRDTIVRGDTPDSADTAKTPSPHSSPSRGRYARSLALGNQGSLDTLP